MTEERDLSSRRDFVGEIGRVASVVALTACVAPAASTSVPGATRSASGGEWDLSWVDRVTAAKDRAVFDWPSLGDPADSFMMQLAERYLDNCDAVYGKKQSRALAVMNIRTTAVPAALNDAAWERFALGVEYKVNDPTSRTPATRNPFWHRAPDPAPGITLPSLADLVARGSVVLVCVLALGHLAGRLATRAGRAKEDVHRELRASFVPSATAVPSGIFGLAKAQNAGCALVHV
jgi:hypothetical protein